MSKRGDCSEPDTVCFLSVYAGGTGTAGSRTGTQSALCHFGGEALELSRLEDWYNRHPENRPQLINMYGITETTVHVSYIELDRSMAALRANSLIGCGIPDLGVYVLDERLQPVPPGVAGELYVSGAG